MFGWLKKTTDESTNLNDDSEDGDFFGAMYVSRPELENMYQYDWLSRAIIDYPIEDMLQPWREFNDEYLEVMKKAEEDFDYAEIISDLITTADLYGSAVAIPFIKGQEDFTKPLDIEKIQKGDLVKILIVDRWMLNKLDINFYNPLRDNYLKPEFYEIVYAEGDTKFHYSRAFEIDGLPLPKYKRRMGNGTNMYWGDSRLFPCYAAIKSYNTAISATSDMLDQGNIDVLKEDGVKAGLSSSMYQEIKNRVRAFSKSKKTQKTLLLDKNSEYDRQGIAFGGVSNSVEVVQEDAAGAAKIPVTRLFGKAKAGMSGDTNDGDLRNYKQMLETRRTKLDVKIKGLDDIFIRSTLGSHPDDISYQWGELSVVSGGEQAEINKNEAETDKINIETLVVSPEEVREKLKVANRYQFDDSKYQAFLAQAEKDKKAEQQKEKANETQSNNV